PSSGPGRRAAERSCTADPRAGLPTSARRAGRRAGRRRSQRGDEVELHGDRWTLFEPRKPFRQGGERLERDVHPFARAKDPWHVSDVGEAEYTSREERLRCQQAVELRKLAVEARACVFVLSPQR